MSAPRIPVASLLRFLDAILRAPKPGGHGLSARGAALAALPFARRLGLKGAAVALVPAAIALGGVLGAWRAPRSTPEPPPDLLHLLADAGLRAARRAFEPRGRWGLRRFPDRR